MKKSSRKVRGRLSACSRSGEDDHTSPCVPGEVVRQRGTQQRRNLPQGDQAGLENNPQGEEANRENLADAQDQDIIYIDDDDEADEEVEVVENRDSGRGIVDDDDDICEVVLVVPGSAFEPIQATAIAASLPSRAASRKQATTKSDSGARTGRSNSDSSKRVGSAESKLGSARLERETTIQASLTSKSASGKDQKSPARTPRCPPTSKVAAATARKPESEVAQPREQRGTAKPNPQTKTHHPRGAAKSKPFTPSASRESSTRTIETNKENSKLAAPAANTSTGGGKQKTRLYLPLGMKKEVIGLDKTTDNAIRPAVESGALDQSKTGANGKRQENPRDHLDDAINPRQPEGGSQALENGAMSTSRVSTAGAIVGQQLSQRNGVDDGSRPKIAAATNSFAAGSDTELGMKPARTLAEIDDDSLYTLVEQKWRDSKDHYDSKAKESLQKALLEKGRNIVREASNRQQTRERVLDYCLPSTNRVATNDQQTTRSLQFRLGQKSERELLISFRLDGSDQQQPRHNTPMTLTKLLLVEDDEELEFVPFFDEGDKVSKLLEENFDTKARDKRVLRGAAYEEDDMNQKLDHIFEQLANEFCVLTAGGKFESSCLQQLRARLEDIVVEVSGIGEKKWDDGLAWVKERFDLLEDKENLCDIEMEDAEKLPSTEDDWVDYLKQVDTYRDFFCERCFIYSCSFHGIGDVKKPSNTLDLQYEKGMQRVDDGYWEAIDFAPQRSTTDRRMSKQKGASPCKQLSTKQKALCRRMFLIFNGDVQKVAAALRAPTAFVAEFVASSNMQLPERKGLKKKSKTLKTAKYTSMRHYNQRWLSIIRQTSERPWCVPCSHTEICSEKTCSCIQNGFFCTNACVHSEYSPNFYRGCDCKGYCNTNTCSCFQAYRECDPELCKSCRACTDPPNTFEKVNQRCHNDNMSMRRHRRLLIAKSTMPDAGWGLFCKEPLKKGDFIHEYLGELITIQEGERRGALYDHAHRSYLFEQSSDYDVDALLKGNKTRFGNHSETPNVDKRAMYVNGNRRIGFFANQNIPAQSELFIDYSYKFTGITPLHG